MPTVRETGDGGLEIREANHRMMNLLATLLVIFRRQFSQFDDDRVRSSVSRRRRPRFPASGRRGPVPGPVSVTGSTSPVNSDSERKTDDGPNYGTKE